LEFAEDMIPTASRVAMVDFTSGRLKVFMIVVIDFSDIFGETSTNLSVAMANAPTFESPSKSVRAIVVGYPSAKYTRTRLSAFLVTLIRIRLGGF